jgi:nucleoside-diphosphate-sugar epimerase
MSTKSIAILGCTGHVGKNLIYYFGREERFELVLFSRDKKKIKKIVSENHFKNNFTLNNYEEFNESKFDVIINCIGISDPAKIESEEKIIMKLTEDFDQLILDYLKNNSDVKLINFSSGAVYGEEINSPINDTTPFSLNAHSQYAIAKIKSEIRHRGLDKLNIVDLRLFSFFSRFMDLNSRFLISEIISSIKQNKKLITNEFDFYRDYIHPKDLFSLLKKCINKNPINDVFDLYSKKPIGKFELLNSLKDNFGLQYEVRPNSGFPSPTGFKKNYYSESRKAKLLGYEPQYSSIETIVNEMKYF